MTIEISEKAGRLLADIVADENRSVGHDPRWTFTESQFVELLIQRYREDCDHEQETLLHDS